MALATMSDGCLSPTAAARAVRSFWLLGLLNNAPWVLMLAVATNISSGGVALVFLANQVPGLIVKITAPYWFHLISYKSRMRVASVATVAACFLVGCGGLFRDELAGNDNADAEPKHDDDDGRQWGLALELFGVSFVSFSGSLGEASLLALAGKFDSSILPELLSSDSYWAMSTSDDGAGDAEGNATQQNNNDNHNNAESGFGEENDSNENDDCSFDCMDSEDRLRGKLMKEGGAQQRRSITAFASGTGLAGIVGYGYKALLMDLFGWGFSLTIWSWTLFAFVYYIIYQRGLHDLEQSMQKGGNGDASNNMELESSQLVQSDANRCNEDTPSSLEMVITEEHENIISGPETPPTDSKNAPNLTSFERCRLVFSLWPYTIPLFTVYAAEYMMQAGVWSAIGFPVTSASARAQFYHYSNWTYQAGVFLSRSSGNLCAVSLKILWIMPMLQVANLYFFWMVSVHHFWYNFGLLLPSFFAGLLGGGVYVQGFSRINADMPIQLREFALSSASVADSLGVMLADVLSLFIQSCIYQENHIEGAVVECPY